MRMPVSQRIHEENKINSSFRGTLRAEESLFPSIHGKEGFLTPFGMTTGNTRSAIDESTLCVVRETRRLR